MVRGKKYDFSDKRDICYKLYVEGRCRMSDLIKYFSDALDVPIEEVPNHQAFNRQFREWGFLTRRHLGGPEEEARVVARIKELYDKNFGNAAITETLRNDGWDLPDKVVGNLRRKYGLVLRGSGGYEASVEIGTQCRLLAPAPAMNVEVLTGPATPAPTALDRVIQPPLTDLSHADASGIGMPLGLPRVAKRSLEELQDPELLQAKKRRRRIRGRGQLPADEPGLEPRYKSETTLDECKAFLQLNNESYQQVRQQFTDICREAGIVKKTTCSAGVWDTAKSRLIAGNQHLGLVFSAPHPEPHKVANAVEVIAADVTKRIRVLGKQISLADANNGLGLNPSESKHVRKLFYDILEADGFTTRMECGDDRWEKCASVWLTKSDTLMRIKERGINDQTRKYLNMLMRDAMKRLNDGRVKKDPRVRQWAEGTYGIGPGPARGNHYKGSRNPKEFTEGMVTQAGPQRAPALTQCQPRRAVKPRTARPDLDPALFITPAVLMPPPVSIAAYFRLASSSTVVGQHAKLWLATIKAVTMRALHAAATSKAGASKVGRVHGMVKNSEGGEDSYVIDSDEELAAYLETVKESEAAGGKVAFTVELNGGYA